MFAVNALVGIALIPLVGWLGDRRNRVRITQIGAVVAGVGALVIGMAPAIWILVIGRMLIDAGRFIPETIHNSLIADYYPKRERPLAFAIHRGGNELGYVVAPLIAAGMALWLGWRWAFLFAVVPTTIMLLLSLRLDEPVRGASEESEASDELVDEPPVPYRVAVRQLLAIRTLRRSWVASAFILGAAVPYFTFASIYFAVSFGVSVAGRGVIGAIGSIAGLTGLVVGGWLSNKAMERGLGTLQRFAGYVIAFGALALAAFAVMPTLPLAVVMATIAGFVFALNQSAQLVILSLVSPPRLRTVAYSFGGLTSLAGIFLTPMIGAIVDANGVRIGMLAASPGLVIGGLILVSAGKFAAEDHRRAVATLETAGKLRRERLSAADHAILTCRDVNVSYGSVQVLFDVDFEVRKGEVVALLGTNGAGKSTLLKAISGISLPDSGDIFFDGRTAGGLSPWDTARLGIVMMPGGKSVFPQLTVRENLDLAAWLYRKDQAFVADRMDEVLALFPRLEQRLDQRAGDLSGGEQQMVSLAQAFIPDPKLLLLDELSLGLAPIVVAELVETISRLHEANPDLTIVIVEQSVNVAMTMADRAYFMEKGEIRFSGATADLLDRPDILRAVFLEGAATAQEAH